MRDFILSETDRAYRTAVAGDALKVLISFEKE